MYRETLGERVSALRGEIPHPSSMMEHDGVRTVRKSGFEGEASHSANAGVIFQRTLFVVLVAHCYTKA